MFISIKKSYMASFLGNLSFSSPDSESVGTFKIL